MVISCRLCSFFSYQIELLERQAIFEVWPEPENVEVRQDLPRYGLSLRGKEHVVQRLSGGFIVLPCLLCEYGEDAVSNQSRGERTIIVFRVPFRRRALMLSSFDLSRLYKN